MSNLKMIGAVAIMVACFAIIYPRFMHPLVLRAFGLYEPPKSSADAADNLYPPNFKAMHPEHKKQPPSDEVRKHMRPGPHPGMRAAAEMQRQQAQQGSGRGMMGVVLPMYAIGIVLYLVYTLFKVFNKSKNNSWSNQKNQYGNNRSWREGSVDRMGFPKDFDGSEDVRNFLNDNQQRKELEELLSRVDDKNVSVDEMRVLQKRLEETEAQMTRILQAMQNVQSNVDRMNIPENNKIPQMGTRNVNTDAGNQDTERREEKMDDEPSEKKGQPMSKPGEDKKDSEAAGDARPETSAETSAEGQAKKQHKEVDLDDIDKDSDQEVDNDGDDNQQEEEEDGEEDEKIGDDDGDGSNVGETVESNLRQRKGRSEHEQ